MSTKSSQICRAGLVSFTRFSDVEGTFDDYPGDKAHLMTAMWATKLQGVANNGYAQVKGQILISGQLEDNDSIDFVEALVEQVDQSLGSLLSALNYRGEWYRITHLHLRQQLNAQLFPRSARE